MAAPPAATQHEARSRLCAAASVKKSGALNAAPLPEQPPVLQAWCTCCGHCAWRSHGAGIGRGTLARESPAVQQGRKGKHFADRGVWARIAQGQTRSRE